MRPNTWLSRLMAACWCGHIPLVTWLASDSLSARAIADSGPIARFFMALLAVSAGGALIDSIVSDALPARFKSPLRDYRHVGFMLMSISLLMLAGILATKVGQRPVLIAYILPGIFAAVVVWPDMLSRHQRAPA